ncbi:MAG: glycosyltransferase [Thermoflexales bacterium]|nr:glycosyltransferase [Thermoflexales bacterium]
MRISVIVTVKNEARNLPRLLDSLAAQTLQPDEVVICDGGSVDGGLELLRAEKRLPLRVILHPGANISQGRNAAIQAANGEIIAVTDAGVWLEVTWLEELVTTLKSQIANNKAPVVGGFFVPDAYTRYAVERRNVSRPANGEGGGTMPLPETLNLKPETIFRVAMSATVLPQLADIKPATFMPSSRSVAFTQEAWQAVGGYPEWLDFCEDLVFDMALRERYGAFAFAPRAIAHFRPRGTLRAFFRQYYQYARGDGKAGLFFKRHMARYGTYLLAAPLILWAGAALSPWWWSLCLLSIPFMFFTPYKRLLKLWTGLPPVRKLEAALWIPLIRLSGDVAKMIGYPVGVAWRLGRK